MGIDSEVTGRIAKIVINRPEALNSMTQPMYADLSKAWIEVRDNPEIWVAVVTGAPQSTLHSGSSNVRGGFIGA